MLTPSLEEYLAQTGGRRRMPVTRNLPADVETPLSAYWKLAHDQSASFLLESVTGGEHVSRYSLLGVAPRDILRVKGLRGRRLGGEFELSPGQDPLNVLEETLAGEPPVAVPGTPAFIGGAVGMMAYDLVRFFERLPCDTIDDLDLDDLAMMIVDTLVVFDHAKNALRLIVLADGSEAGYRAAEEEISRIEGILKGPLPSLPSGRWPAREVRANVERTDFETGVERIKRYIAAGDGIQMVPSIRFETEVDAHPVSIYRALRSLNPSPYMFLLRFGDFDLVGASPELLTSLHGRRARVRPIAGTRRRGETEEADQRLAEELLSDEKERAEHIMLVDLGRNDLGRVCEYGSVTVNELMVVERYSHVMHLVSDVSGRLRADLDAYDLLRATFPAGTVSGAPKVRAMEIIEETEPTRRGSYAGAVGFIGAGGDMDTCIAIRTILIKGGRAFVQAGAGIVHESCPAKEYEECVSKARASLRAIELAQAGL